MKCFSLGIHAFMHLIVLERERKNIFHVIAYNIMTITTIQCAAKINSEGFFCHCGYSRGVHE